MLIAFFLETRTSQVAPLTAHRRAGELPLKSVDELYDFAVLSPGGEAREACPNT
jgi:hypothetical protein